MAAVASSIKNYNRVVRDLDILSCLTTEKGQESKLVYSLDKGLALEFMGFKRAAYSLLNYTVSYLKLDSGYSREIKDLIPIIKNIKDYCLEAASTLERPALVALADRVSLAIKGLIQHTRKYEGKSDKQKVIQNSQDMLVDCHAKLTLILKVKEKMARVEEELSSSDSTLDTVIGCRASLDRQLLILKVKEEMAQVEEELKAPDSTLDTVIGYRASLDRQLLILKVKEKMARVEEALKAPIDTLEDGKLFSVALKETADGLIKALQDMVGYMRAQMKI